MGSRKVPNDWQLNCGNLSQRGRQLLNSGQFADCTFLVGTEPVVFTAHKLLLTMASPVFQAMFFGSLPENAPIKVSDIHPDIFRDMLKYIYTDKLVMKSFEQMCDLFYAARKYMIRPLANRCLEFLKYKLTANNVCQAYEIAKLFEEETLVSFCLQKIQTATRNVLNDSSFEEAQIDTLVTIFSQEELAIESEMELFHAAEKYSKALKRSSSSSSVEVEAKRLKLYETNAVNTMEVTKNSEGTEDTEMDENTHRQVMRKVIEQIRFLTFTPAQFASGPVSSKLLTDAEAFSVLLNIADVNTPVPMPKGFSTNRRMRASLMKKTTADCKIKTAEASIEFVVLNIKSRKRTVECDTCYMDNVFGWCVQMVPEYTVHPHGDKTMGVFVKCTSRMIHQTWSVPATVTVTVSSHTRPEHTRTNTFEATYTQEQAVHGCPAFLTWDDLCNPSLGYLKHNKLNIEVFISARLPYDP